MRSIHFLLVVLFSVLLGSLSSCYIETAKAEETRELVIASDYLTQADTTLFSNFISKTKTRLIIREINTDQLIGLIRNADHNSGLDLIMMESVHNVVRVHKQQILQPLSTCAEAFQFDTSYVSYRYNYVGFGIDPFVVRYDSDTISGVNEYEDLKQSNHINQLDFPGYVTFLSPLRKEMSKVNTYEWAKKWHKHSVPLTKKYTDSLPMCLGTYSSLYDVSDDTVLQHLDKIAFPQWKNKGTFYNLRTMAIIKQAEHFSIAKEFIAFYRNPGYNGLLTEKLNLYRVNLDLNPTQDFILSPHQNQVLIQYHTDIERINTKLNK